MTPEGFRPIVSLAALRDRLSLGPDTTKVVNFRRVASPLSCRVRLGHIHSRLECEPINERLV
jgi:hypothetical protein